MECWEQSTHLSWLTTNTTQSHTKKQHLFLRNKNKRENTKSFNFHQHSLASPAQQSLHMSIEAKLHLAHKLHTARAQIDHQLHTKLHTPPDVQVDHKLHAIPFHFRSKLLHKVTPQQIWHLHTQYTRAHLQTQAVEETHTYICKHSLQIFYISIL